MYSTAVSKKFARMIKGISSILPCHFFEEQFFEERQTASLSLLYSKQRFQRSVSTIWCKPLCPSRLMKKPFYKTPFHEILSKK